VLLADASQPVLPLAVQLDLLHGTPRPAGVRPRLLAEGAASSGEGHRVRVTR
jgi:hypothetical protein